MPDNLRIVVLGAGNVATHLAIALQKAGFVIEQVFSRTLENAKKLATTLKSDFCIDLSNIKTADVYIYAVSDHALQSVIQKMSVKTGVHIHTSGSISIDIFESFFENCAVIYPLQTFSKDKFVDFKLVPLFVEATTNLAKNRAGFIANKLSNKLYEVNSQQRMTLHISAVFACNFSNYMYVIASKLLNENDLPFNLLMPLIEETTAKLKHLTPFEAQTGPARRYDFNITKKHIELIDDEKIKEIYTLISSNISDTFK